MPDPSQWAALVAGWQGQPGDPGPAGVALAPEAEISLCGLSLAAWQGHLWLQKLPIPALADWEFQLELEHPHRLVVLGSTTLPALSPGLERLALNLELPPIERAPQWLAHLRLQQGIWDPDPARVQLMLALGLPAHWLDPSVAPNGWLQRPEARDPQQWARDLGLAPPQAGELMVLGPGGDLWDRALAAEARASADAGQPAIAYQPGWPHLVSSHPRVALAQAGWLAAAADCAARLVWMAPEEPALTALAHLSAPPLPLQAPMTPAELRAQVVDQPLMALAIEHPSPPVETLYSWGGEEPPDVAVVVSLFNYSDRIEAALDSAARQSQVPLELVVVDDASTDGGAAIAEAWMARRVAEVEHPFVRLCLLRHHHNAGLAAARNTGFAAAKADWCFVLDADNVLYPHAVAACHALARQGGERLAVVHPLLAVAAEPDRADDQRTLVGTAPWQRETLCGGNTVDAMALVRRSAWHAVGGYTHIEGGWEDYDFWCKLIDAGFHGLQCPRVLAEYRSHSSSMSHMATNRQWRALSRTLQRRHPWLRLPLA